MNTLQDKWEDKLLGYLSEGLRIGFWQQEFTFLESHIIGDPTFRFSPHDKAEAKRAARLEKDLVSRRHDTRTWEKYLKSEYPNDRAAAILHLADARKALDLLKEDPSWVVRISAFDVLRENAGPDSEEAILTAVNDPFELVVRQACRFASARGDAGKDSCLVRAMEKLIEYNQDLARVNWDADDALTIMRGHEHLDEELAKAADPALPGMQRIYAMRSFRNYRYLKAVSVLLANAGDSALDANVRQVALETLGWFDSAPVRGHIVAVLKQMIENEPNMPEILKSENIKTQKRLSE